MDKIEVAFSEYVVIEKWNADMFILQDDIELAGVSFIAAIGITLSLFLTKLVFIDNEFILSSKLSIPVTAVIAGILGCLLIGCSLNDLRLNTVSHRKKNR